MKEKGIKKDEKAPLFTLPIAGGGSFSLEEHIGQPLVIVFFRGTW